ncbi:hypothetical protein [Cellulomonas denverensis]|uniref:Uncharacterized protein n=2 Tax=Cellulomonas denverensis TaxID=264297 RepID=A0A7X6KUU0_9CELL|nr:hypothetical protein [Cellulomonas denverensis]NKY22384.1 hypothetical protein [Cellulomonas denverensis]GIG26308.1 hypothetical protein Cde04nite_25520 [Cellulomonas denverensis]
MRTRVPAPAPHPDYGSWCAELLAAGDWHGLYQAAMRWRTAGGGSFTPDAWLMDVASALLHRQPTTAVHCCDLALTTWVERPADRLVLRHLRGVLIADHVGDPARALDDLTAAATDGPDWLRDRARADLDRVRAAAGRSRVRSPRVGPSPEFDPQHRSPVAPAEEPWPEDGARPAMWDLLAPLLAG